MLLASNHYANILSAMREKNILGNLKNLKTSIMVNLVAPLVIGRK